MPVTYKKIASVTVGAGGASNIEFTSIPSTYTDILVKLSLRTNRANTYDDIVYQFNNDTTSGRYAYRNLYGTGGVAGSDNSASSAFDYLGTVCGASATASTFTNQELYIPNYAGSTAKSSGVDSVMENNAGGSYQNLIANLYTQTTAISSIKFYSVNSTSFVQYSTATLYAISKS